MLLFVEEEFTLIDALGVAGVGILIVFAVLSVLVLYLLLQGSFFKRLSALKDAKNNEEVVSIDLPQSEGAIQSNCTDSETIAAVMAAVYACLEEEKGSDNEFLIRSIYRAKSKQLK